MLEGGGAEGGRGARGGDGFSTTSGTERWPEGRRCGERAGGFRDWDEVDSHLTIEVKDGFAFAARYLHTLTVATTAPARRSQLFLAFGPKGHRTYHRVVRCLLRFRLPPLLPTARHLTWRCELVTLAATWGLKAAELEPDDRAGSVSSKARASGPGGSEGSPSQETTANESTPPRSVLCCLARRYAPTDVSVAAVRLY